MVTPRLILILGDQLSPNISSLAAADKSRDVVVMAEVMDEAEYAPHHPQKIILILSAMRKFADRLRADGWQVAYSKLDDPANSQSLSGELLRRADAHQATSFLVTQPGEWRVIEDLENSPLHSEVLPDTRFVSGLQEFADWAEGRKALRMEYFYRDMRRKTGLLMADDGKPEGGKWNYDQENRKPAEPDLFRSAGKKFKPDPVVREVIDLVKERFGNNFGDVEQFFWATDAEQAEEAFAFFLKENLPDFGAYQDAMLKDDDVLHHALISAYLNIGLLDPLEVCRRAEAAYQAGQAPLNSVEGFIRQIIGWREYVRGIYFLKGPEYTQGNYLSATRALPQAYWGGACDMNCLRTVVGQIERTSYAHHIQRLMVTGNFALLAGIDPAEVHEWYLGVFIDAFEWVEAPNTVGMSQFADGGVVASKPYISSGAYINRMSDYCASCRYKVSQKRGEGACPFNYLYWNFLDHHRESFANNPRMAQMYRVWDKMSEEDQRESLQNAADFLDNMSAGKEF